jgi:hypothetical protein
MATNESVVVASYVVRKIDELLAEWRKKVNGSDFPALSEAEEESGYCFRGYDELTRDERILLTLDHLSHRAEYYADEAYRYEEECGKLRCLLDEIRAKLR